MMKAAAILTAAGLLVPAAPALVVPAKPALVRAESLEFSKHMLAMPVTMGMMKRKAAAAKTINVAYIGTAIDTSNSLSYTFSSQSIGTPSADRYVVVGLACVTSGTAVLSGVTIGGAAADLLAQSTYQGNLRSALLHRLVPTGTTANIVVTLTGGGFAQCMGLAIWNVTGNWSGVSGEDNSATSDDSGTVFTVTHPTVLANDKIITIGRTGSSATTSWTNAVEDFDLLVESNQARMTGATSDIVADASNYVITGTLSGSQTLRLSSARYY